MRGALLFASCPKRYRTPPVKHRKVLCPLYRASDRCLSVDEIFGVGEETPEVLDIQKGLEKIGINGITVKPCDTYDLDGSRLMCGSSMVEGVEGFFERFQCARLRRLSRVSIETRCYKKELLLIRSCATSRRNRSRRPDLHILCRNTPITICGTRNGNGYSQREVV